MASAALTSMASGAAVSAINNQGNLGAIAKDVFSSDSLKGYVLAGASAGIASQFGFNPTTLKFDLASAQSVAFKVAADAAAKTAIMGEPQGQPGGFCVGFGHQHWWGCFGQ